MVWFFAFSCVVKRDLKTSEAAGSLWILEVGLDEVAAAKAPCTVASGLIFFEWSLSGVGVLLDALVATVSSSLRLAKED